MEKFLRNGVKTVRVDSVSELGNTAKQLLSAGRVALFSDGGRYACRAEDVLKAAGYAVDVYPVNRKSVYAYKELTAKELPEDCRLAVAVGEEPTLACAKVVAGRRALPLLAVPVSVGGLSALFPSALFYGDGELVGFRSVSTVTVLLCEDALGESRPSALAEGLGLCLCGLVSVFDCGYENLISGRLDKAGVAFCDFERLSEKLSGVITLDKELFKLLCTTAEELADGGYRIFSGVGFDFSWLISLYKRQRLSYNESYFTAAYTLLTLYSASFAADTTVLMPPDRLATFSELERTCGITYGGSAANAKTYAEDYRRRCFVTADYKKELTALLNKVQLSELSVAYRRLHGSSGFGLRGQTDFDELIRLMHLSGENCVGYPLLKHLYTVGFTDALRLRVQL